MKVVMAADPAVPVGWTRPMAVLGSGVDTPGCRSAACPCRSRAAVDSDASRRVPVAGVGKLVRRRTGQGAPRRVQVDVDPGDRAISVGVMDVGEADHRLAVA